jgi:hypothetical protein
VVAAAVAADTAAVAADRATKQRLGESSLGSRNLT